MLGINQYIFYYFFLFTVLFSFCRDHIPQNPTWLHHFLTPCVQLLDCFLFLITSIAIPEDYRDSVLLLFLNNDTIDILNQRILFCG